ncbi:MAG: metalloregulator ArsR/SmtB family transcription factor [Candidatus Cloacimonetes bacterium]|nr:metalloregulator ArsR/SmtB family transcription factor [Candidatus Cloacimonadota bacterium]
MVIDRVFKAFSDLNRRQIIKLLRQRAMYPSELADLLGVSKPTVSEHLKILHTAGLVEKERQGNNILYFLNTSILEEAAYYIIEIIDKESK